MNVASGKYYAKKMFLVVDSAVKLTFSQIDQHLLCKKCNCILKINTELWHKISIPAF